MILSGATASAPQYGTVLYSTVCNLLQLRSSSECHLYGTLHFGCMMPPLLRRHCLYDVGARGGPAAWSFYSINVSYGKGVHATI